MLGLGSLARMRLRGMSRAPFMAGALGMRRPPMGLMRPSIGMASTPASQGISQGLSQLGTTAVAQPPQGPYQGVGMYQNAKAQAPDMRGGPPPGPEVSGYSRYFGPRTTAVGTPQGTYDSATGAFTPFKLTSSVAMAGSDAGRPVRPGMPQRDTA